MQLVLEKGVDGKIYYAAPQPAPPKKEVTREQLVSGVASAQKMLDAQKALLTKFDELSK